MDWISTGAGFMLRVLAFAALLSSGAWAQDENRELEEELREVPSTPVQVVGVQSDSAAEAQVALQRELQLNSLLRSLNSLEDLDSLEKGRISQEERRELERRFRKRFPEKVLKEKRLKKKKAKK